MKSRLDYSAILHCSLMNNHFINTFYLSATLKEKVNSKVLQLAVNKLMHRYPLFFSKILKDKYWYYVESLDELFIEEKQTPFSSLNYNDVYQKAIAVLYYDKTISLEVFHSITDGVGAVTIFKKLIEIYLKLLNDDLIDDYELTFKKYELEDDFELLDTSQYKRSIKKSFQKTFQFQKKNIYSSIKIRKYIINLDEIKKYCKSKEYKVNEFILSIIYKAISHSKKDKSNISLLSPVNLRNLFHTHTLRGFTLCASLTLSDKNMDYDELVNTIRNQMDQQKTSQYFGYEILKMKNLYNHFFIKKCPLWLKDILIRIVYKCIGEKSCMTVSNLGKVIFDNKIEENIESLEFALSPRYSTPINCGVISSNNQLVMSVTHDGDHDDFLTSIQHELDYLDLSYISLEEEY